jgi:methylated-DNA-[protein]-cysteine S-methyltransferase
VASRSGLRSIEFGDGGDRARGVFEGSPRDPALSVLRRAREELAEYFEGDRTSFDLPLDLTGTEFQRRVWAEVRRIPYGETVSYGELARRLGRPSAARAVGGANARNPVPIVVPCHRVVGASGQLTGFGGSLARKEFLLGLETGRGARPDSPTRGPR